MICIGIHGPDGSGKSTVAAIIEQHCMLKNVPVLVLPFAKPLKDYARMLGWNGEKDAKGRRLLRLLGTECGRECIDTDLWVKKWAKMANDFGQQYVDCVVISDDMRFFNEYIEIRKQPISITIKLKGRGTRLKGPLSSLRYWVMQKLGLLHRSEKQLPDYMFEHVIHNVGSHAMLRTDVILALARKGL